MCNGDDPVSHASASDYNLLAHSLLTSSLSELGSLKDFDTSVVKVLGGALAAGFPVLLMLQRRPAIVQVPRSAGHILRDMWVDLLALLIDLGGRYAGFSSFFKLLLPSVVFMILEQSICRGHTVESTVTSVHNKLASDIPADVKRTGLRRSRSTITQVPNKSNKELPGSLRQAELHYHEVCRTCACV